MIYLINAIAFFLSWIFKIVYFLLIIRIIMSWVGFDPYNEIARLIYGVTEPIMAPFRRLPLQVGPIDFSPMVVFVLLYVAENITMDFLGYLARLFV